MLDLRCFIVSLATCGQRQQWPSVHQLPSEEEKSSPLESASRPESFPANTNSRPLLQVLCRVWRQIRRENERDMQHDSLRPRTLRYERVDLKSRVRQQCSGAHQPASEYGARTVSYAVEVRVYPLREPTSSILDLTSYINPFCLRRMDYAASLRRRSSSARARDK